MVDSPGTDRPIGVYGETWVFESIVGAVPGVDVSDRTVLLAQFVAFEALVVVVSLGFDRTRAILPGTAAILVATAGSGLMLDIGRRLRSTPVPRTYRQLLFSSSLEVVLGVLGYAAVLTVLFVYQPRHGPTFVDALLGPTVQVVPAFLFFMVLWDLCYRIGTGWWIGLLALWRTVGEEVDPAAAADLRAVDYRTAAFGLVQLTLVPFVWDYPVLVAGLVGHVLAVLLVVGVARARTR